MTQRAARMDLARPAAALARALAAPLLVALLSVPVLAGDRAILDVIGYSGDHGQFAFEEFGIQDGSGFAYSNIYVIDIASDTWVSGTPVRVRAENENRTLAEVRAEARAEADDTIATLGLSAPAQLIALIGDGVPDIDAQTLRFAIPGYGPGETLDEYELNLSSFFADSASPCLDWFSAEPLGYELTISDGDSVRVLHRDTKLPQSRGCPVTYRLSGVFIPFMAQTIEHGVAIISVYPGGFEGPDRRFLAVPLGS